MNTAKATTTAANHILIDGWTITPRQGVYAEKINAGMRKIVRSVQSECAVWQMNTL